MSKINTKYPVQFKNNREVVLELTNELTSRYAADIEADFLTIKSHGVSRLIIDFSDVSYINSTGIAVLMRLINLSREADIALAASGLSTHYKEIFDITKLGDYIEVI
jgi:anti-anti-sigma factor